MWVYILNIINYKIILIYKIIYHCNNNTANILICNSWNLSFFLVKLNGGRHVIGILRGFDPFMNMVIDESIEECKDGTKNNIGMVVR